MAGSLRDLATFHEIDVISALHPPLTPEPQTLQNYVFLPFARTGIAAALTTPFAWGRPARTTVQMKVPVVDDTGSIDAEMTVHVYGPADVKELDPSQVVRVFPKADVANAEIDDLAHIEFDRPDLPWLFTPAGPTNGRLMPWLTLVVVEQRAVKWGERRGAVRRATLPKNQLQPLDDAWAWAHAQVMGTKGADANASPTLNQRLAESNAAFNLSRLICPRRLDDYTAYTACVVPTFDCGRLAGLGLTPGATLTPSWDATSPDEIDLPVYYSWSFATGEAGNFESLANKLKPRVAPPGVGRRRVDTTHPWLGDPPTQLTADDPGAEMVVEGPVVSPQKPVDSPEEQWPTEAQQQWDPAVADGLVTKLNNSDVHLEAEPDEPPIVGPPLYGGNHAQQRRIREGQPEWFTQLNTDPRNRIVGGLGTRVVQMDQESLMASAWNQVIGVEKANRALRLAQLAKVVSASLHARHLARFDDATLLSVTERVHAKVLDAPERTVWAKVEVSSLPLSVTTGTFRKMVRPRGPVGRLASEAVGGLTVRPDRLTTDWVRTYANPDSIDSVSPRVTKRLAQVADRVVAGADADTLLRGWSEELAQPGAAERLDPTALEQASPHDVLVASESWSSVAARALAGLPTFDEMAADPDAAATGAPNAVILRTLASHAESVGLDSLELPTAELRRLGLGIRRVRGGATTTVPVQWLSELSERTLGIAHQHQLDLPLDEYERTAERLTETLRGSSVLYGDLAIRGLSAVAQRLAVNLDVEDSYADHARDRVDVPALDLIAKLDPRTTVPARVHGRLTAGTGKYPSWLRPDWFDDLRIEPVMAAPHFPWPMYEPLHRYDKEWMVPGLGLIPQPDMATLLLTNNKFIESYLVGLNHEMGRELLWREYPTDQRGTYFDSFWTGQRELVSDLHELPWRSGELRSHVDKKLDGRLVFLVRGDLIRRYPGVVAHAALEADRGPAPERVPIFAASSPAKTLFHVFLPPNVLLVGFSIDVDTIKAPGPAWWFTLSENPTEPRFGLDPSRDGGLTRDDLIWDDFGVAIGGFLDANKPAPGVSFPPNKWGTTSAQVAALLFQLPARAAFLGTKMVAGAVGP